MVELGKIKLFNLKELCEKFKVTPVTMRNYLRNNDIPGFKIGGKWYASENAIMASFSSLPSRGAE